MALRERLAVAAQVLQGASHATLPTMSRLQRLAFEEDIKGATVTAADVAELSAISQTIRWHPADADRILQVLEAKSENVLSKPSRRPMQNFVRFLQYLTATTWALLADSSVVAQTKQAAIINNLVAMMCLNPDEHTLKLATSLQLVATVGFQAALKLSPEEKANMKKEFKKALKRMVRRVDLPDSLYIKELLAPEEQQRANPEFYDAIKVGVSATPSFRSEDIERVAASFSCRYNAFTERSLALSSPSIDSSVLMMDCLRSVVQMLLVRNGDGGSGERRGDDLEIQYTSDRGARRTSIGSDRLRETLGLPIRRAETVITPIRRAETIDDAVVVLSEPSASVPDTLAPSEPEHKETTPDAVDEDRDGEAEAVADNRFAVALRDAAPAPSSSSPSLALLKALQDTRRGARGVRKRPAAQVEVNDVATDGEQSEEKVEAVTMTPNKKKVKVEVAKEDAGTVTPKAKTTPADKSTEKLKRRCAPRLDFEMSRNQILGRTGFAGPGQSTKFRFGAGMEFVNIEEAEKAARVWLDAEQKKQGMKP